MLAAPQTLFEQARLGSEVARGELLEAYRPYLELLSRVEIGRRLQTKVDTADIVQETFLEAHRNFAGFRGRTAAEFVQWLREILAGRVANVLRHYLGTKGRDVRRERSLHVDLDQSSRIIDRGLFAVQSTPSQQVVKRETGLQLAAAISKLPDAYRDVVVLRHLEECSFAEVATRMGRSVDSVQKLWVRALASLREQMEPAL